GRLLCLTTDQSIFATFASSWVWKRSVPLFLGLFIFLCEGEALGLFPAFCTSLSIVSASGVSHEPQPWPACCDVAAGRNRGRRPRCCCLRCGVGAGTS